MYPADGHLRLYIPHVVFSLCMSVPGIFLMSSSPFPIRYQSDWIRTHANDLILTQFPL